MSRGVSLTTLIQRVRRRADIESATARFPDAEITDNINESAQELYDLIRGAFGQDYYRASFTVTFVPGQAVYSLPADFLSLISVDVLSGSSTFYTVTARPYMENERNAYKWAAGMIAGRPIFYRLTSQNITFIPTPEGATSAVLNYVPTLPLLVNGGDILDGIAGWEEYVVLDAAIKCLVKDEANDMAGVLEARKAAMLQRIERLATERDAGQPERVHDVTTAYGAWPFPTGWGWGDN